jgi:hypothetical protein
MKKAKKDYYPQENCWSKTKSKGDLENNKKLTRQTKQTNKS